MAPDSATIKDKRVGTNSNFTMSSYAQDRNTVRESVKYVISDTSTMLSPCKKNASGGFNVVWGRVWGE